MFDFTQCHVQVKHYSVWALGLFGRVQIII